MAHVEEEYSSEESESGSETTSSNSIPVEPHRTPLQSQSNTPFPGTRAPSPHNMATLTAEQLSGLLQHTVQAIDSLGERITELVTLSNAQQQRIDSMMTVIAATTAQQGTIQAEMATFSKNMDALGDKVDKTTDNVNQTATAVQNMAGQSIGATSTGGRDKSVVPKPAMFNGSGDLSAARFFLATFINWAMNQGTAMNQWNATTSQWERVGYKWVSSVLNFLTEKARTWALPHLELVAQGKFPFTTWEDFEKAFRARFEPVDVKAEAQKILGKLEQGTQTVQQFKAKFDEHAPRTEYGDEQLARVFYKNLSPQTKNVMLSIAFKKDKFEDVWTAAQMAWQRIQEREEEILEEKGKGKGKAIPIISSPPDPDAMDIDAARLILAKANGANGAGPNGKTIQDWKKAMTNRCNRCASRDHVAKDGKHERDVCDWCIKDGHRSTACMRKFMGHPRTMQKVNANGASEASGSGQTQGVATVGSKDKDSSAEKMKELEAKIALLMAEQEAIKASF